MMATVEAPVSCQVYTSPQLAGAMIAAIGMDESSTWLEPSCGTGVFLRALGEQGVSADRITAIDLDRRPHPPDTYAHTIRGVDSIKWLTRTRQRFDRIVGNPPYVALRVAHPAIQQAARVLSIPGTNTHLSLGGNLWAAFCCAAIHALRHNGRWAFVLPAAWDYADYAQPLRTILPTLFESFCVFRCNRPLFSDVQDGSIVVVGFGYQKQNRSVVRVECESCDELCTALRRWGQLTYAASTSRSQLRGEKATVSGCALSSVAQIRLGGVTGQAGYFLMTESQRRKYGLPQAAFRPVVTRACHVETPLLGTREWNALREADERIWLFHPGKTVRKHPAVQRYLRLAPERGGCARQRYKIRNRHPWYLTPLPRLVDGFLSGMSSAGPVICFRDMPRLSASNTLYTIRFATHLSPVERFSVALALLSTPVLEQVCTKIRRYPSGLGKLEPGDIAGLVVPRITPTPRAISAYSELVNAVFSGDADAARIEADKILGV